MFSIRLSWTIPLFMTTVILGHYKKNTVVVYLKDHLCISKMYQYLPHVLTVESFFMNVFDPSFMDYFFVYDHGHTRSSENEYFCSLSQNHV